MNRETRGSLGPVASHLIAPFSPRHKGNVEQPAGVSGGIPDFLLRIEGLQEFVRLPLLAAATFEHCGNLPQLAPANHARVPPAIQLSLMVQLVTFLLLGTSPAPVLLKHQGRLRNPALFTVCDETAQTPRETGMRSGEGGRHT